MRFDRCQQVCGTAVVQEEDALPDAPERCAAELVAAGSALPDVVSQSGSHMVNLDIAEQVGAGVTKTRREPRRRRRERSRVADRAADGVEQGASLCDRR